MSPPPGARVSEPGILRGGFVGWMRPSMEPGRWWWTREPGVSEKKESNEKEEFHWCGEEGNVWLEDC